VNNENDENVAPTRLTRAKAAALGGPDELSAGLVRKALQSKKAGINTTAGAQRKRAALGDVSNFGKNEPAEDDKELKKAIAPRAALVSKAAQNGGVQKLSRNASTRSLLSTKDTLKKTSSGELKRPASGSGVLGNAHKKRSTGSSLGQRSVKEETPASENEVARKQVSAASSKQLVVEEEPVKVELKQGVVAESNVLDDAVPDLDADDLDDPLMVAEYAVEIFEYLRELEEKTAPNPDYMKHQDHLEWQERDILNDWLIQVHQKFTLLPETLYLTINIIDRFLTTRPVQLDKLQLVGITAMFIASKYEEVMSPHVTNFEYIAKDYTVEEILSAERFVLSALNYDLSYPNPMNFLRRISKADNYDIQTRTLGKYLLEISCLDHRFLKYNPSHVAAAAMYMSRAILERGDWVS
jgi:hypothetical protein